MAAEFEAQHPRRNPKGGGKFSQKEHALPEGGLATVRSVLPELGNLNYLGLPELPTPSGVTLDVPDPAGGYNQVERHEDGTTKFLHDGRLHRQNGPAVFNADGSYEYWLNGKHLTPPDVGTGEPLGLGLVGVSGGVQEWDNGGSERKFEALVYHDGSVSFAKDGELHRVGGPAHIDAYGHGTWYRYGTPVADPIPQESEVESRNGATITTGSLYQAGRDVALVARNLRQSVAYAAHLGVVPEGGQVAVSSSAAHNRITLRLTGVSGDDAGPTKAQLEKITAAHQQTVERGGTISRSFDFDIIVEAAEDR